MSFASCALVSSLIPNLLNGASDFEGINDATILPGSLQIVAYMSSGCELIIAKVNSMGYIAPHPSGTLNSFFGIIEANYAAWQSELARSSPRTAKGERSRADDFRKAYEAALRALEKMDLSMLGFTQLQAGGAGWYIGGRSQAEKDSVASDTDRVDARFKRDKFVNPDRPVDSTDDDQER
ncbi:MAG: hypothetical protein ACW99J_15515 [Candidatus Thorarchaeota archaeon]|jgi:hypothetical protein